MILNIAEPTNLNLSWAAEATRAVNQLIGKKLNAKSVTANYTLENDYDIIKVDTTGGNVTISLPAAGLHTGRLFFVKRMTAGANTLTIDPNSTETIDGAATLSMATQYEAYGLYCDGSNWLKAVYIPSSGGVSDGDKGDITVSSTGAVWTIDNDAVTYPKIQNVSATDKLLGRSTAGAGDIEEIACTAAGRAILDDADAAAQRTTLGLAIGTNVQAWDADLDAIAALSGTNTIYYRSAANTWSAVAISNDMLFSGGTLGQNKGTAFPTTPASGDRFTRTDRNIDYFYDGTRWLSTQLHTVHLPPSDALTPATATTSLRNGRCVPPFYNLYDVYLVDAVYWYVLVGTGDWTTVLLDQGGGTLATLANITSTSNVSGRTSLNLVRTATQTSYYYYTTTENSGTASLYTNWAITYRLIG